MSCFIEYISFIVISVTQKNVSKCLLLHFVDVAAVTLSLLHKAITRSCSEQICLQCGNRESKTIAVIDRNSIHSTREKYFSQTFHCHGFFFYLICFIFILLLLCRAAFFPCVLHWTFSIRLKWSYHAFCVPLNCNFDLNIKTFWIYLGEIE